MLSDFTAKTCSWVALKCGHGLRHIEILHRQPKMNHRSSKRLNFRLSWLCWATSLPKTCSWVALKCGHGLSHIEILHRQPKVNHRSSNRLNFRLSWLWWATSLPRHVLVVPGNVATALAILRFCIGGQKWVTEVPNDLTVAYHDYVERLHCRNMFLGYPEMWPWP